MDTKRDMEERLVASILAAYHTTRLAEVGPITHIMAQGPVLQCFKNLDEYATLPLVDDNNFQNLPLNESFERVAKVAEERAAFNEQMKIRAALEARGLEIKEISK
jgi:hypothetical protein